MVNFEIEVNGEKKNVEFVEPTANDFLEAQKVYNTTAAAAIQSKSPFRVEVPKLLKERGLVSQQAEADMAALTKRIKDAEITLAKGNIKKSEAKAVCLDLRVWRGELNTLISAQSSLDNFSVEAQAEDEKFNYMVAACTVYSDTKQKVFKSYADYKQNSAKAYAMSCANHYMFYTYGVSYEYQKKLPENEVLLELGFVNEDLRLINSDGQFVDSEGRLIDEDYNYIDEHGNKIDKDGNPIGEDGKYKFERQPFLDD